MQVVYPLRESELPTGSDGLIESVLHLVGLRSVVDKWSLDGRTVWLSTLAAGQMQALGFARVFYHSPAIVFMDEATSMLDVALEARLLQQCRMRQISIVGVCHRASAMGFHDHCLEYTGENTGSARLHDPAAWQVHPVEAQVRGIADTFRIQG